MARDCSVCADPRLGDIHRALDAGDGTNATARAFEIAPTNLKRHLAHRPATGAVTRPPGEEGTPAAAEADLPMGDIEGRLHQLLRTADRLRVDADVGTLRDRSTALGQCRQMVRAAMELYAQLQEGRETAVLESPQWTALRQLVLDTLRPFPEARAALLDALRAHERA